MAETLTGKQEKFAQLYVELGNASEAYRGSYSHKNKSAKTVNEAASRLLANSKVLARVKELQDTVAEAHGVTVNSLMAELDEARLLAKQMQQPAAMTTATMGKAKIAGLDKQVIEHSGSIEMAATVNVTIDS